MVQQGDADACVSGLTYEYPEVIRPALQIFHTRPGINKAAGAYIVIAKDNVYIFTDATVNIDPSVEDLAEIALLAADLAEKLELDAARRDAVVLATSAARRIRCPTKCAAPWSWCARAGPIWPSMARCRPTSP